MATPFVVSTIGALICGGFVGLWVVIPKGGFERMVGFGGRWRSVGFPVGFDFVLRWIGGFPTWGLVLIL